MSIGRKAFLGRIASLLGHDDPCCRPEPLQYSHEMQQAFLAGATPAALCETFIANARAVGIHTQVCKKNELAAILCDMVCRRGNVVVMANDPFLHDACHLCQSEITTCSLWGSGQETEDDLALAEQAKVGIAVAELALAETATSLLFCHQGHGRSISLLPESSIIVIRASTIVPRLTQAMEWLGRHDVLPSAVTFISGPSSTADIELVRVQGVHGPLELCYVVVE